MSEDQLNNRESQEIELESLQAIYDEEQFQLLPVDDGGGGEQQLTFKMSIKLKPNMFGEEDESKQESDVLKMRYHIGQTGVRLIIGLTEMYPSHAIPSLQVHVLPESSLMLFQPKPTLHKDLLKYYELKKQIAESECKDLLKKLEERLVPDGQPMLFAVIVAVQDIVCEMDKITDDKLSEMLYEAKTQEENAPKIKTSRIMKLYSDSDSEVTVTEVTQVVSNSDSPIIEAVVTPQKKPTTKSTQKEESDKFEHIHKYSYRDATSSKWELITLSPYLIFDKYTPSKQESNRLCNRYASASSITNFSRLPVIFGGISNFNSRLLNDVCVCLPDSSGREKVVRIANSTNGCRPGPRLFASLTAVSNSADQFVLIGGMDENGTVLGEVFFLKFYDTERGKTVNVSEENVHKIRTEWSTYNIAGICGHSATALESGAIMYFGGWDGRAYSNSCNTLISFTSQVFSVCITGSKPAPRAGAAISELVSNCVFITGGHDDKGVFSDTFMLDTKTNSWTRLITMGPSPSLTHSSSQTLICQDANTLLMHGGYNGSHWENAFYEYTISEKQWRVVTNLNDTSPPLAFSSMVQHHNGALLLGGSMQYEHKFDPKYQLMLPTLVKNSSKHTERNATGIRWYQYQMYMDQKFRNSYAAGLMASNRKWFKSQDRQKSDLIFEIYDPSLIDRDLYELRVDDFDGQIPPDEDGFCRLYCHKIVMQQSPKLAELIAKHELRRDLSQNKSQTLSYEEIHLSQGEVTVIPLYKEKGFEFIGFRLFAKLCHYLYTNSLLLDTFLQMKEHLQGLWNLSKLFKLPLLTQMLTGTVTVKTLVEENMFVKLRKLSEPLLVPKRLSAEEYRSVMKQLRREEQMARDFDAENMHSETNPIFEDNDEEYDEIEAIQRQVEQEGYAEEECSLTRSTGMVKIIAPISPSMRTDEENEDEYLYIEVHEGLLVNRSLYFKSMFQSQFSESESGVVRIDQVNIGGIRSLCSYMYSGLLPAIEPADVVEVYLATHQFVLEELQAWLRSIMRDLMDINIVCAICDISESLNDKNMRNFCIHFIAKHIAEIIQPREDSHLHDMFQSLSKQARDEILLIYHKMQLKK